MQGAAAEEEGFEAHQRDVANTDDEQRSSSVVHVVATSQETYDEAAITIRATIAWCLAFFALQPPTWWPRCALDNNKNARRVVVGASWRSPAGLWFVFIRVSIVITIVVMIVEICQNPNPVWRYSFRLPMLLGTLSNFIVGIFFLPQKYDEIRTEVEDGALVGMSMATQRQTQRQQRQHDERALILEPKDADNAAKRSIRFVAMWSAFGLIAITLFIVVPFRDVLTVEGMLFFIIIDFVAACGTLLYLGGTFFALSLDVAKARRLLMHLAEGAWDQTLTADRYRSARDIIRVIFKPWNRTLWLLGAASLYNMAGMLVFILANRKKATADDELHRDTFLSWNDYSSLHDLNTAALMGKEAILLLHLTYRIRIVNDEADDVVTDVFQWQSEQHQKKDEDSEDAAGLSELEQLKRRVQVMKAENRQHDQESRRLSIFFEGSNLPFLTTRNPSRRRYMFRRLVSSKAGGIKVTVMGVRWTTDKVHALALSFVVSFILTIFKKYIIT